MFSQTRTRSPESVLDGMLSAVDGLRVKGRTVPVGDVLVGNAGSHIEHDDTALAVDVVTITETAELLLTSGVPDIELDLTEVLSHR